MTFGQILFGFRGRLARLPYFGYFLLAGLLVGLMGSGAVIALTVAHRQGNTFGMIAGVVLGAAVVIGMIWMNVALTIKRLHDLDLSGLHMIWIWAIGFLAGAIQQESAAIAIILYVASLCVGLYLLFAPGTPGSNRFGPRPGGDDAVPAMGRIA